MVINTMSEEKNKESRFHFVSKEEMSEMEEASLEEDVQDTSENTGGDNLSLNEASEVVLEEKDNSREKLEEVSTPTEDSKSVLHDDKSSYEDVDISEQENKATFSDSNSHNYSIKRPYFGFETRVILLLLGVLVLIAFSCYFFYKAVTNYTVKSIPYDESSTTHYKVCLNGNAPIQPSCLGEDMEYNKDLVKNIVASFEYDLKLSSVIDYDLAYQVIGLTRIYDPNDSSKDLYKTEDILVNKRVLKDSDDAAHVNVDAEIDFSKFNSIVQDYKKHYSDNVKAVVDVILYLEKDKKRRSVASITIPLDEASFSIGKTKISNVNQAIEIKSHVWNKNTLFYTMVATILLILSMVVLYKMARLVWKVTNNRNIFQTRLSQILRDYDRIIVIARDGYASNIPKRIIKVETFEELLSAREALEKPIIYSKVNSIKSEFIVEDDEKLYKYVLKESDL